MKNILLSILVAGCLVPDFSLAQRRSAYKPVNFKKHESYFFGSSNSKKDKADLRYMFFTSQREFEKYFSPAATNKPVPLIDFSANYVGAIVYRETDHQVDIGVDKLEIDEEEAIVYVSVKKGNGISYRIRPSYVFSWPINRSTKRVRFITNGDSVNATIFSVAEAGIRKLYK